MLKYTCPFVILRLAFTIGSVSVRSGGFQNSDSSRSSTVLDMPQAPAGLAVARRLLPKMSTKIHSISMSMGWKDRVPPNLMVHLEFLKKMHKLVRRLVPDVYQVAHISTPCSDEPRSGMQCLPPRAPTACIKGSRHSWHHRHHRHCDAPWPHFDQPRRGSLCAFQGKTPLAKRESPTSYLFAVCNTKSLISNFGGGQFMCLNNS